MASKRAQRRKTCGHKRRYESRDQALTSLIGFIRAKPSKGMLRIYHCRFCHGFHYGHSVTSWRLAACI